MKLSEAVASSATARGVNRPAGRWRLVLAGGLLWLAASPGLWAQPASQALYLQCLTNFETYAQSIWHASGTIPDAGYWGDGGSTGNGGIRGNSGIAVAYAVLCLALPDDPKYATRLAYVRQALNYDYNTHVTGGYNTVSGGQWGWSNGTLATCTSQSGSDWQTAEWSGSMGLACLLMQSNLPAATVAGVQRVVISEANHRATIPPCTRILSDGDTKAEENGWDGNVLALAAGWMTNNASASNWLYAAKSYLANTYTVAYPDLITPDTIGDPLAPWVSTVTVFPSYALENHGFYHPTYEMVAGMSAGDSLLMARLADPGIAVQLQPFAEHNVMAVWTNNLDTLVTSTGDFAYPSGVDWSVRDFEHNSFMAFMAAHFNDPLARWADQELAQCVRYRQLVNGDGTFVGMSANPGGGILFYREAVEARRTAIAWLQWHLADFPAGQMTAPASTLMNNTDVQVIHQRSPFGTFSVSYNGARVMANVEAVAAAIPTNAFVSSPRLPGILGLGALGNPTGASLISYATNTSGGFDAELKVTSSLGATEAYIKSTSESVALIEVPTLNSGATPSSGGSFICGIENDPLTGGSRLLEWSEGSATISALSGTVVNATNNWICVSGRYGLAAGPAGYFRYAANTSYTRTDSAGYSESGEAEDALSFVENNQIAPRYAVWFPAQSALQTSNAAAAIAWVTSGTAATLTFPGAGGVPTTLVAPTGSGSGIWKMDANGLWSGSGNWENGVIAGGAGDTADFSAVSLTADRTVTLDSGRVLGALKFGDPAGGDNWTVTNSAGSTLTLNNGSGSPTIAVANTATLALPLAGNGGFTKSGPGTLILSGANPLAGAVYVDNGLTGSTSEGAVRIANGAAVANVTSPIYIRDNNSASSTLQFDGSSGDLNLSQGVSLAGRNAAVFALQNLAGSNTIAGDFILASGGGDYWFDADAGTLNLAGQLPASAPSVPSGRTLTFMGAGDFLISGSINNANGYPVSVVKDDAGTLRFNGVNTFTGTTTVNGGTLAGSGALAGPVMVAPGASLAPGGDGLGPLTINNALTNNGAFVMRLNKSGSGLTNDSVQGVSTLAFGGPLELVVSGDPITVGDSFKLFSAAGYRNFISGISPVTPGTNLLWNTANLAVNGTLSVALGVVNPAFANVMIAGTNLVLAGGGGAAGYGYSILTSTNLALPPGRWMLAGTGTCDLKGNFVFSSGFSRNSPQQFYVIHVP